MAKNVAVVLDIGSSAITALVGKKRLNNILAIYSKSNVDYSGFSEGKFFEEEKLEKIISQALKNVKSDLKFNIKEITIGVPSEFCISKNKKISVAFNGYTKLSTIILNKIYSKAVEELDNYTLTTVVPIYHILDDKKKIITIKPNLKALKLTCLVNAIYVENNFIKNMNLRLSNLGIQKVNYVSSIYAEALYLFNQKQIENAILVDIGYLTTSVVIKKGKGLLQMNSFSLGGGHIMADIVEGLNLTVNQAESLKKRIVLSLKTSPTDVYEIFDNKNCNVKKFKAELVDKIVFERLDMFVSFLKKCLNDYIEKQQFPIFLTGGGISYIKGAREYISDKLGDYLKLIKPEQVEFNRPENSSIAGVLAYALKLF